MSFLIVLSLQTQLNRVFLIELKNGKKLNYIKWIIDEWDMI